MEHKAKRGDSEASAQVEAKKERERAALNSIVLVLLALLARYVHHLFFLGEL